MPEKKTLKRAAADRKAGKSPSTQAGEFVREEIHHVREGKHGARSAKQAIAIGLSKARRAGVRLPPPKPGTTSAKTRERAKRDARKGSGSGQVSPARSRAARGMLARERSDSASPRALARQAKSAARRRGKKARSRSARKAAQTKGPAQRSAAARKAARTRARNR
jgi:hypothetical protein